jgi:adenylate cyclase
VRPFDARRYAGEWFEIMRLDHRFEARTDQHHGDLFAARRRFRRRAQQVFDRKNCRWKQAEGRAVFQGAPDTASLTVTFFWPFAGARELKSIVRPLRIWHWSGGGGPPTAAEPASRDPSKPSQLSIVVLAFANLSADQEQEFFVGGLTEDLTTDLSRLPGSFVIARNTAFTYKCKPIDVKRIGSELGVLYVLEGSIRRVGDHVRIKVQLIDAGSGAHLWAERFDGDRAALLDLQDAITGIANALRVELIRSASRNAERRRTGDSAASDLVMRGRAIRHKPSTVDGLNEAQELFERALALDDCLVDAWSGLSYALGARALNFPDGSRATTLATAEAAAMRALSLDSNHAESHFALGRVRMAQGRFADAASAFTVALELDRNYASALTQLGLVRNLQ